MTARRLLHPLDRYVFGEFLKIMVATALGFPILVIVIDVTESKIVFQVNGPTAKEVFKNEAGGHRFQREPPNERNGHLQGQQLRALCV